MQITESNESPPARPTQSYWRFSGKGVAFSDFAMASSVALARCRDCERLHAEYEHMTVIRMQAEADLLAAVHSRNAVAIQATARTLRNALVEWGNAHTTLRQHEKSHDLALAA